MSEKVSRDYQQLAMRLVYKAWREAGEPGTHQNELGGDMCAVILVSPTGSGKTHMGSEIVKRLVAKGKRVLWIAHRSELIEQAAEALSMAIGQTVSTTLCAQFAPVIVCSIQTLIAADKEDWPKDVVLVVDECHHIVAPQWRAIPDHYHYTRILGLTATPTRKDEIPLGVVFGQMVNAVHYSELIRQNYLVDCTVYAPAYKLDKGIAMEPLAAYEKHLKGKCGFVYVRTKLEAEDLAVEFTAAGVPSAAITDSTPGKIRTQRLKDLKSGKLLVLMNVYTLTEGVDVPCAEFVMLARNCGHISMFLQIVGRALRIYPGKMRAIIVDLVGAMREHGFPTEDRYWDIMSGKPNTGDVARYGVECPDCMAYFMRASKCPECNHDFTVPDPDAEIDEQRVYNVQLQCITTAAEQRRTETSPEAKRREWLKLVAICESNKWSLGWAADKYKDKYSEAPDPDLLDAFTKLAELKLLIANAIKKGQHGYYVSKTYKQTFGEKPNFSLVDCEALKKVTAESMKKKSGGKLTRKDRAVYLSIFGR